MKPKTIIRIVAGLLFWPPIIYLGFLYGWRLPVMLGLIFVGLNMQQQANDL